VGEAFGERSFLCLGGEEKRRRHPCEEFLKEFSGGGKGMICFLKKKQFKTMLTGRKETYSKG